MSETLLYIPSQGVYRWGDGVRRADERVMLAQSLGFTIKTLFNEADFNPDYEDEMVEFAKSDDCIGLWLDVHHETISPRSKRILFAAHEAGKNILGFQACIDAVIPNLESFIGLPNREETNNE